MDSPTGAAMQEQGPGDPGVSDGQVLFGQSAAFTGPAGGLGNAMRLGIQAAFQEANRNGGVHGRELRLESLNDSYEADFAFSNTRDLIEKAGVFALIGAVGTPTARAATPQAHVAGVP
ncbi:MAG: ABC transporter substrate-binding protein, partial [Chloroflexi bacterium]|nr:ABC transporter substrate-binding protein [Chloroflexota bacterium]